MSASPASTKDCPTRRLIVEKTRLLLSKYGQEKVTVVDVARELGMSHANIYRFFRSKTDILDAVIDAWLADVEDFYKDVAGRPGTVTERLEAVVLAVYQRRRAKYEQDPKVFLAFRRLIESRPDAVEKRKTVLFNVFREMFEEGIAKSEFTAIDAVKAAMVLEDATAIFLHPLAIPNHSPNSTEERLKRVIHIVLGGLAARR